jgi:hypothetical protein
MKSVSDMIKKNCMGKLQHIVITVLFLASSTPLISQSLPAGAIGFIGFQSDVSMAIAFVNTVEIEPNTIISFTDNKWTGSALLQNEQTVIWTSPDSILPPGEIVILQDNGSSMNIIGPGSSTGRLYYSLGQGEQILAYTGTAEDPSFIAGISSGTWRPQCDNIPYLEFATCLPQPLVNGETAFAFVNTTTINIDNGFLNISPLQVFGPEALSIIYNINYWTLDNGQFAGTVNWPDWDGGSTQPFASEINFEVSGSQIIEGGSLATIILNIAQPQPTPQSVEIEILEFPGITPQDYSTNPVAQSGIIQLTVPANASTVSFTVQALADGLSELNENVTFLIGNLSGGLTPGDDDSYSLTILSTEQEFPEVNFTSDTLYVTEGMAGTQIDIQMNPVSQTVYNIVVNAQSGPGVMNDFFTTPSQFSGQLLLQTTPGNSLISFTVTAFDDIVIEADEYLNFTIVQVSNGIQIGAMSNVVVVLKDNDNIPVFNPPALYINEINAFNVDFPDENGQLDDWIELYNASDEDVDISNYSITNNIQDPLRFVFPSVSSQMTIPAGGYKIIWADQNTIQGPLHINFTLNENGGFLGLFGSDGETFVDGLEYPALDSATNYGRFPDGENWQNIYFPTPEATNSDSIPEDDTGLFDNSDWHNEFSIYPNPSNLSVSIVKLGNITNSAVNFEFYDLAGRHIPVASSEIELGKFWKFDIQNIPQGVYFVKITSENKSAFFKLLRLD